MATLEISSGVHVGARGTSSINQGWFAASATTQFTTFSLTSTSSDVSLRQGPQSITGHADLVDEPIAFEFSRRTRDTLTTSLAAVAVKDLLNGGPRTTLTGARDAVARSGFLAKFAWAERTNAGGANTSFSVWGVAKVAQPSVRGLSESMTLLVYPCSLLWWTGTESAYVDPTTYAALEEAV